ncbi:Sphingosine-1-phosphate phosphatase 1 [Orchesella cincta]|uniref:Sphingosine-1-phosphate phosphatase 1 n=1 Tax=Orchesella cincta TaxID=48709 RepID=A0A1D2MCE8_ORCCI|nr:Sphingosine-1-phosphate phosphatase 1 [Orchesella cincta]
MERVSNLFEELKGPHLVARFQNFCGLRRAPSLKKEEDGEITKEEKSNSLQIDHKWLLYLFLFGTSLGDETFYSIFFTFWFWSVDGAVGRRVVLVWGICMYIGQSLKDIIRWPRPSSPPVVKLERKWELEYGMPSTHAIVGAAVPLSIVIFTSSRYQYSAGFGVAIAITICSLVCLSRLYLGMHSVLDILAGLGLVASLLPIVIPLVDKLDSFFLTHEMDGLPLEETPSSSSEAQLDEPRGLDKLPNGNPTWTSPSSPPYVVMWPTSGMILLAVLRQCLGLGVVLLSKMMAKKLAHLALMKVKRDGELDKELDDDEGTKPGMGTELFTKFLTYTLVGLSVTYASPNLFRGLGIERPTFHTEI